MKMENEWSLMYFYLKANDVPENKVNLSSSDLI